VCGLAGFVDYRGSLHDIENNLKLMINTLNHRGPDGEGVWLDTHLGIGLGHKRLSILDLSGEGKQPMISSNGRYVITYNGEIYNFEILRIELKRLGCTFRGHSDTEVVLAAFETWGIEKSISRFIGMFALALWDRTEQKLYLVRDRLGIKPLYYGHVNGSFIFGSELKALRAFPKFNQPIYRDAIALFLRHNYIPAPYSIYEGIKKLLPGQILTLNVGHGNEQDYQVHTYWSAAAMAEKGINNPFTGSETEAVDQLDTLLRDSISLRMLADVPLGAFLSGGIDSSVVTALMQAQSNQPIKTFSIGFHEKDYNEAEYAKAIAQHLGTDHTELYIRPEEAMAVIPDLPFLFDEPFSDSSQIPTYLVSKLARNHVTVSLSGDGGDELFHGYSRYFYTHNIWKKINLIPKCVRPSLAQIIKAASLFGSSDLQSLSEVLSYSHPDDLYRRVTSHWKNPTAVVLGANEPWTPLTDPDLHPPFDELAQRLMFFDLVSYLPDDILTKVDRASMGVSLEARVPLLDHRVVEFAWRLPLSHKIKNSQGKWILRQLLYKYVPQKLVERPKKGFGVPIGAWLRGPLREWAEELLDEHRLRDEGFFNPMPIRKKWQEHLAGKKYHHYYLWDVLMFQSWLEANKY